MVNINWQEIKDKYPKAYEKFLDFYNLKEYVTGRNPQTDFLWSDNIKKITVFFDDICFCNILKFFDNVGVIIIPKINNKTKTRLFRYYFYDKDGLVIDQTYFEDGKERGIASDEATIKAFEILNTLIEKGEIK